MHVDVQVVAIRELQVGDGAGLAGARISIHSPGAAQVRRWEFTLAHVDAARESSGVVVDAIVGDLEIMTPGVDEDAATALGTVTDTQSINARWVAQEVARERVVRGCGVNSATSGGAGRPVEKQCTHREGIRRERIGTGRKLDTLTEDGDGGEEGWL